MTEYFTTTRFAIMAASEVLPDILDGSGVIKTTLNDAGRWGGRGREPA